MLSYALGNLTRPGINFLKIRIMETGKNESAFKEVMMRQETAVKALQKVNNTLSKTLEEEMGIKIMPIFLYSKKDISMNI